MFCTYCLIPYARGPYCSQDPQRVLEQLHALADAGYREVVLSGIHLGAYGVDLTEEIDLFWLLRAIENEAMPLRIRISSIDPQEINEPLLEMLTHASICRHLHLAVQSGSDQILQAMRRPYETSLVRNTLERIYQTDPSICVGMDILCGFPGESSTHFDQTHQLLSETPWTYLHVFPFSPRKGTVAATLPDPVPDTTARARARILRQLSTQKRHAFYRAHLGQSVDVLVEEPTAHQGLLRGLSDNYLPVRFNGPPEWTGNILPVRLNRLEEGRLYGETMNEIPHGEVPNE